MTVGRETVEAALFDGFRGTALGGAHEGWSRNMARIATDAVMPLVKSETSERESIADLLRRRAAKEAPNAAGALLFMADIVQHDRGLPEDMLGPVSETPEVETQWATYAIGVFGPAGQNARFFDTEDEAWADAQDSGGNHGPGTRKRVVIDGVEFFTEWTLLAKTRDEIENWKPKGVKP